MTSVSETEMIDEKPGMVGTTGRERVGEGIERAIVEQSNQEFARLKELCEGGAAAGLGGPR